MDKGLTLMALWRATTPVDAREGRSQCSQASDLLGSPYCLWCPSPTRADCWDADGRGSCGKHHERLVLRHVVVYVEP